MAIKFQTNEEEEAYKLGFKDGKIEGHGEGFNSAYDECVKVVMKRLASLLKDGRSVEWTR